LQLLTLFLDVVVILFFPYTPVFNRCFLHYAMRFFFGATARAVSARFSTYTEAPRYIRYGSARFVRPTRPGRPCREADLLDVRRFRISSVPPLIAEVSSLATAV